MKRSRIILLTVAAFIAGIIVGGVGISHTRNFGMALTENKIAAANLAADRFDGGTNLSPEFREYLKARIYHNVYSYYPSTKGYLLQKDWDFGPVDHQLLTSRHIIVWKDIDEVVWDWSSAITNK